jgi:hypothetical protein
LRVEPPQVPVALVQEQAPEPVLPELVQLDRAPTTQKLVLNGAYSRVPNTLPAP